jgi:hypothetical protein
VIEVVQYLANSFESIGNRSQIASGILKKVDQLEYDLDVFLGDEISNPLLVLNDCLALSLRRETRDARA